jgi:hypothetical protein
MRLLLEYFGVFGCAQMHLGGEYRSAEVPREICGNMFI